MADATARRSSTILLTTAERMIHSVPHYWVVLVSDGVGAVLFLLVGVRRVSSAPLLASVSVVLGFISWGVLEYGLHRWVLHGRPSMARRSHARHHADPAALISAPILTALAVACTIWAMLSIAAPAGVACLGVFGVYAGYNYYALLHHLLHRRGTALARVEYFARRERVHHLHHTHHGVNYGVSTTIWDRLLGTFQPSRARGHDEALEHHPIVLRLIERQRAELGRARRLLH